MPCCPQNAVLWYIVMLTLTWFRRGLTILLSFFPFFMWSSHKQLKLYSTGAWAYLNSTCPDIFGLMDGIILIPSCFPLCSDQNFFRNRIILQLFQGSCDILVSERCRGCWLRHGHWGTRRPTKGGSDVALETLRGRRSWSFRFGCGPRCWHLRCYISRAARDPLGICDSSYRFWLLQVDEADLLDFIISSPQPFMQL